MLGMRGEKQQANIKPHMSKLLFQALALALPLLPPNSRLQFQWSHRLDRFRQLIHEHAADEGGVAIAIYCPRAGITAF